jgi:hypothetical protein
MKKPGQGVTVDYAMPHIRDPIGGMGHSVPAESYFMSGDRSSPLLRSGGGRCRRHVTLWGDVKLNGANVFLRMASV